MSDDRKSPSGKMAKNWGRRDNIRAGAVSGPWRSTPREGPSDPEPEMPRVAQQRPTETFRHGLTKQNDARADATRPFAGPPISGIDPGTAPSSDRDGMLSSSQLLGKSTTVSRNGSLFLAIFIGTVVALAIVMGAVFIRSEMSRTRAISTETNVQQSAEEGPFEVSSEAAFQASGVESPSEPETPGGRSSGESTNSEVQFTPAPAPREGVAKGPERTGAPEVILLRLRVGPGFPEDDRLALLDVLKQAGHERVLIEEIPFPIALSRVGYYVTEDKEAAEELAEDVSSIIESADGEIAVRDYGNLMPDADPGRLDLWIKSP